MKTLILAILLLVPVPAHADTLVLFDEGSDIRSMPIGWELSSQIRRQEQLLSRL